MLSNWKTFVRPERDTLPRREPRSGLISYGPASLQLKIAVYPADGPEQFVAANPQLFATGSTSRDEGYAYWALLKKIGPEGGEIGKQGFSWYYQSKVGQQRAGSATVDFIVERIRDKLGIRIVTPWFHIQQGPQQDQFDQEQIFFLIDNGITPVDVYSQNYINDRTGRSVIKVMVNAISDLPDNLPIARHYR